jgi:hypothetical protein
MAATIFFYVCINLMMVMGSRRSSASRCRHEPRRQLDDDQHDLHRHVMAVERWSGTRRGSGLSELCGQRQQGLRPRPSLYMGRRRAARGWLTDA